MFRSTFGRPLLFCAVVLCVVVTGHLVTPWQAVADSFGWWSVGGSSFVTGVRDQGEAGTCWAFGATAALEAKYLITRNDPTYTLNLSEQHLVSETDPYMGGIDGGWSHIAMTYFTNTGIVREAELPYTAQDTSPYWPLQDGWEDRVVKSTGNDNWMAADAASVKTALKNYGPLVVSINSSEDLDTSTLGSSGSNHAVLLIAYVDNSSYAGGGYYYVKNSWGADWSGDGYGRVAYGNLQRHNRVHAITGQSYYTGSMGTLTWTGSSGGFWTTNPSHEYWTMGGAPRSWPNGEYSAVFDSPTNPNISVYIGDVSVHRLDINSGATGYWFAGDRQLLVTGGGIHTQEDCTLDSTVALGMDQEWTVAAGKTLTVDGKVKMHINSLTIGGEGQTTLNGVVEDVHSDPQFSSAGLLTGYHPGLTKEGSGKLLLDGANTYTGGTTVNGGTLVASRPGTLSDGRVDLNGGTLVVRSDHGIVTYPNEVRVPSGRSASLAVGGGIYAPFLGIRKLDMGSNSMLSVIGEADPHADPVWGLTLLGLDGTASSQLSVGVGSAIVPTLTLDVNDQSGDFPGGISGEAVLVKTGSGTQVLRGANTYTGGTRVGGGVLRFDSTAAIPASGAVDVHFGGTAATSAASFPTLLARTASTSVGTAALTSNSTADVDMTALPNLSLGAVGTVDFTHNLTPHGSTYRLGGGGGTLNFSSAMTGARDLVVGGGGSGGVVVLTGANSFTGATTINGGTLQCGDGTSGHDGSLASSQIINKAALVYDLFGSQTYGGAIAGIGSVRKMGPGTLLLSGTNTYIGGTTVGGGTLQAAKTAALAGYRTPGRVSVAGTATLAVSAGESGGWNADDIDELLTANGGGFAAGSFLGIDTTHAVSGEFIYADASRVPQGLKKLGTGTLSLTGDDNFSGDIHVQGGTLAVSYAELYQHKQINVWGDGSTLSLSPGSKLYVGFMDTGTLTISDGGTVVTHDLSYLGYAGTGTATVAGHGSTWINNDRIFVGSINSELIITDGGSVTGEMCLVGANSGSTGTVTVDGYGSTLHNNWSLDVGSEGDGTLIVTNGGTVSGDVGGVGTYRGGSGAATVNGPGSTWANGGDLQIAACYGYVGGTCSGTLDITGGGSVSNANAYIGYLTGATGTVMVSDYGSTWNNNGFLYVGETGSGSLSVADGALVSVAGGLFIDADGLNSDGYVNITTGGSLALAGQADSSLNDYLGLVQGTDAIYYWDDSLSDWSDIATAIYGEDYTLTYMSSGDLAGFTVLTVGVVPIDFDGDGACDIGDLNSLLSLGPLVSGIAVTPGINDQFDLTGDDFIDNADVDQWLADAATYHGFASPYKRGDANLDGVVDVLDFNEWNSGKFTSSLLWNNGDFNGDGSVDVSDFNIWNGSKFTSSDQAAAVPEPSTLLLVALGLAALARRHIS